MHALQLPCNLLAARPSCYRLGSCAQDDWNNFLWNVVMLAMGGSALGEAVKSSGLLADIAHAIEDAVRSYSIWQAGGPLCSPLAALFVEPLFFLFVFVPLTIVLGLATTLSICWPPLSVSLSSTLHAAASTHAAHCCAARRPAV